MIRSVNTANSLYVVPDLRECLLGRHSWPLGGDISIGPRVTLSEGPAGSSVSVAGAAALVVGAAEFGVVAGATAGAWTRGALDVFGGAEADGFVVAGFAVVDGADVVGLDGAAEVGDGAVAVGVAESVVCVAI